MSVHDVCMYVSGDVVLYFLNTADINKKFKYYIKKKRKKNKLKRRYTRRHRIYIVNVVYMCKKYKNTHVCIYIKYKKYET